MRVDLRESVPYVCDLSCEAWRVGCLFISACVLVFRELPVLRCLAYSSVPAFSVPPEYISSLPLVYVHLLCAMHFLPEYAYVCWSMHFLYILRIYLLLRGPE